MSNKVEIDKELLLEIAGFLLASSHYYDMDKLPVKFIAVADHFGYKLDELCGDNIKNALPGREYNLFDSLCERYLNSDECKNHAHYVEELIKSDFK